MTSIVPSPSSRRFLSEFNSLVGKEVEVVLVDGRRYRGKLLGFEHPEMNLVLADARSGEETIPRLFIMGRVIAEIRSYAVALFDPAEFASYVIRRLGLRQDAVRAYPDAGVVTIYNSIRVTQDGVEGSGPLAAKVSYILKEYMEAKKRGERLH